MNSSKFLLIPFLVIIAACQNYPQEQNVYLLGTYIRISSQDPAFSPALWEEIVDAVKRIDRVMNAHTWYEESELFMLQTGKASLSADTYALIERAVEIAETTKGAFNPAIQPLIHLWGFGSESPQKPSDAAITSILPLLDYTDIQFFPPSSIALAKKGMGIDLGGIAKGYAAELAAKLLQEAGVSYALLDFGGNIVTLGTKPSKEPWRIGLRNPFGSANDLMGVLTAEPGWSIITSGAYERYFTIDDIRYHHIFDYRTGYPADSDLASVTIVSKDGVAADAFSTAGFVMGRKGAQALINAEQAIAGILVDTAGKVWVSPSLANAFALQNDRFSLVPWQ